VSVRMNTNKRKSTTNKPKFVSMRSGFWQTSTEQANKSNREKEVAKLSTKTRVGPVIGGGEPKQKIKFEEVGGKGEKTEIGQTVQKCRVTRGTRLLKISSVKITHN